MAADLVLERDCLDPAQQHRAVLGLADRLGQRLRVEQRIAGRITLTVRYADRSSATRTRTLPGVHRPLTRPRRGRPGPAGRPRPAARESPRLRGPRRRPAAGRPCPSPALPGSRRRPGPRRRSSRRPCPSTLRDGSRTPSRSGRLIAAAENHEYTV
ncbi:hypothetical protein [Streptomyces sp. WAC00263]|uniref:DinB/UmuC family translesion DNA polymerase n=1 Tax=Streptomyces sp. WAC00263 TaxID=1917422 RepID=UPI001F505295|nr:hypothetical protein [Streptomyces sp. WAC00263]